MIGVIQLKKYRTMRQRYGVAEGAASTALDSFDPASVAVRPGDGHLPGPAAGGPAEAGTGSQPPMT
jgi:hypothetical protein